MEDCFDMSSFVINVQGDQLYMAVFFWYLVQCTLYTCTVAYTGKVTFYKVPEQHGHAYLVTLLVRLDTECSRR